MAKQTNGVGRGNRGGRRAENRASADSRRGDRKRASARSRPAPAAASALPVAGSYVVQPPHRCLRAYAVDPSLSQRLETLNVAEVIFKVPWEKLEKGPKGEYLEVIDFDPANRCFYEPVDLDDPQLLAQNGLPPSEGTPQFHQQMVYAVASLTIKNFERALGRKVIWSPGPPPPGASDKDDSHFVRRLRIYPHALREANAYYSPTKKALLFGYFPATTDEPGEHLPGGMTFTCLSHDVVAHETTHALLDSLHRRFINPTNPDVLAFHEAFADVVALLQHFTLPEVLRHQIAHTRGDIRNHESLLGELAGEFGRAVGMRGALRSAIGRWDEAEKKWVPHPRDPREYQTIFEPHLRGAILVAAVFDAFLSIYEARVAGVLRLATGGTGVLPAGAIHPDLVEQLAMAASKTAGHVLSMCVRALDYCPPVDITFGEFLRALITADYDLVRDDDLSYRVAFVEAFRCRGIYPRDLRTLAVETLRWCPPENDEHRASPALLSSLSHLREWADEHAHAATRDDVFKLEREMRAQVHQWLETHFRDHERGLDDAEFLGLDTTLPFEVHALRVANRVGPDGELLRQIVLEVLQEKEEPVREDDPGGPTTTIEGGCTLIADLGKLTIDYCIRKDVGSRSRLARQRQHLGETAGGALHATYFGEVTRNEPVARLHRGGI